jgi:hypothetical protein
MGKNIGFKGPDRVSISLLHGRVIVPCMMGTYQMASGSGSSMRLRLRAPVVNRVSGWPAVRQRQAACFSWQY